MEIVKSNSYQENWKEEKGKLRNEISSLKKEMNDYKKERKAEWILLKNKFKEDINRLEHLLDNLSALHKKNKNEI